MLQAEVIKSSSVQNRQNGKKIFNTEISSAISGVPISMWELHRNSSFHLLCSLSGRAAAATVAGNPICKFKMNSSVSLGGVALTEPVPTPPCSSCPRTPFQSWSLPRVGAFVSLSEANVSQGICSTWELFSHLEVTVTWTSLWRLWRLFGKGILCVCPGSWGPGSDAAALPPSSLCSWLAALPWAPTWPCGGWNFLWIGVMFSPKVKPSPLTPRASEVTFCYFRNSTRLYLL